MYDNESSTDFRSNELQERNDPPIKVGEWIWSLILVGIPLIGFAMLLIWGFDSNVNKNKSNWAKAQLILMVIAAVLYGLFFAVFGVAMMTALSEMNF
ncbi:MAG: hypothetical protein JXR56_07460 [Candidatus Cloacimonetes bacterium]|nr:hypothetical protein [Candidatus Cloacimonadota bacterium]